MPRLGSSEGVLFLIMHPFGHGLSYTSSAEREREKEGEKEKERQRESE